MRAGAGGGGGISGAGAEVCEDSGGGISVGICDVETDAQPQIKANSKLATKA